MAHPEELLAGLFAVWGTASLRGGREVPWTRLEAALSCDLTGRSAHKSQVRFPDEAGNRTETPEGWLQEMRSDGATRLGVSPPPPEEGRPAPTIGGSPVDEHMLHAFAGTGGVVLAASVPPRLRRFRTRPWLPPETTLTVADVLAFVAGRATADELRDALLWQDEHNLHLTDGKDWSRFVAALRPEHQGTLVRAMDRVVNNTRFTRGEADGWRSLRRSRANPDCAWQFDCVRIPDTTGEIESADVGAQSERMRAALVAIEAFARGIGETSWADVFRAALGALDGGPSVGPVPTWFEEAGMRDDALRLLASSVAADVFGGMGSWNDRIPEDREGHRRVSTALFRELMPSLMCAVNASTGAT